MMNNYIKWIWGQIDIMFAESINVQRQISIVTSRSDKPFVKRKIDMNTLRDKAVLTDGRIPKVCWGELCSQHGKHTHEFNGNCLADFDSSTRYLNVYVNTKNMIQHYEFINILPDTSWRFSSFSTQSGLDNNPEQSNHTKDPPICLISVCRYCFVLHHSTYTEFPLVWVLQMSNFVQPPIVWTPFMRKVQLMGGLNKVKAMLGFTTRID